MTEPGLCKICSAKPLACSKCNAAKEGQKRTLADFNLEEILGKKRTKELRRARCKQCEAGAPVRTTKAAKCKQCGHWKSRSHVTGLDSEANEGMCRNCAVPAMRQRLAHICSAQHLVRQLRLPAVPAKKRTPRQKSPHLGLQQVCRQQAPQVRSSPVIHDQRRLLVQQLPLPAMSGGCGQAHARESTTPISVPTGRATSVTQTRAANAAPKTAHADSWCNNCAFPPCQRGCGQARPRKGECHGSVCPTWICNQCAANKCSHCGGDLPKTPTQTLGAALSRHVWARAPPQG